MDRPPVTPESRCQVYLHICLTFAMRHLEFNGLDFLAQEQMMKEYKAELEEQGIPQQDMMPLLYRRIEKNVHDFKLQRAKQKKTLLHGVVCDENGFWQVDLKTQHKMLIIPFMFPSSRDREFGQEFIRNKEVSREAWESISFREDCGFSLKNLLREVLHTIEKFVQETIAHTNRAGHRDEHTFSLIASFLADIYENIRFHYLNTFFPLTTDTFQDVSVQQQRADCKRMNLMFTTLVNILKIYWKNGAQNGYKNFTKKFNENTDIRKFIAKMNTRLKAKQQEDNERYKKGKAIQKIINTLPLFYPRTMLNFQLASFLLTLPESSTRQFNIYESKRTLLHVISILEDLSSSEYVTDVLAKQKSGQLRLMLTFGKKINKELTRCPEDETKAILQNVTKIIMDVVNRVISKKSSSEKQHSFQPYIEHLRKLFLEAQDLRKHTQQRQRYIISLLKQHRRKVRGEAVPVSQQEQQLVNKRAQALLKQLDQQALKKSLALTTRKGHKEKKKWDRTEDTRARGGAAAGDQHYVYQSDQSESQHQDHGQPYSVDASVSRHQVQAQVLPSGLSTFLQIVPDFQPMIGHRKVQGRRSPLQQQQLQRRKAFNAPLLMKDILDQRLFVHIVEDSFGKKATLLIDVLNFTHRSFRQRGVTTLGEKNNFVISNLESIKQDILEKTRIRHELLTDFLWVFVTQNEHEEGPMVQAIKTETQDWWIKILCFAPPAQSQEQEQRSFEKLTPCHLAKNFTFHPIDDLFLLELAQYIKRARSEIIRHINVRIAEISDELSNMIPLLEQRVPIVPLEQQRLQGQENQQSLNDLRQLIEIRSQFAKRQDQIVQLKRGKTKGLPGTPIIVTYDKYRDFKLLR